jgi:ABC-type transporter Mla MlaB component
MFRIQQTASATETVIAVEGRLVRDYVSTAESCCDQAFSSGKPVIVFLKDVSVIDSDGRALLARLLARGARIRATGVYTQHLVEEITRDLKALDHGVT